MLYTLFGREGLGMYRWWVGRGRVAFKECKTAIREFTYGGYSGFTANPYNGCGHRCVYCYATYEWFPNFYDELQVKINFQWVISRQLWEERIEGPVFLSSATDPYQPIELTFELTRKTVKLLQRHKKPYYIFTKSANVMRDIWLHAGYRDKCLIVWSLTTLEERVKRLIEPFLSPPKAVLKAMRELSYLGVEVGANIDPIIPGLTDLEGMVEEVVDAVAESGGSFVSVGVVRLREDIWNRVNALLMSAGMEDVAKHLKKLYTSHDGRKRQYPPPRYLEELEERVRKRAERSGLTYGIPLPNPEPRPLKTPLQARLQLVQGKVL